MKVQLRGRGLIAVGAVAAVLAVSFLGVLGVRSGVAGPGAGPSGPVPTPVGHAWTELQGHGDDGSNLYISTQDNQALELRVNGNRALRLEPTTGSPNVIGGRYSYVLGDTTGATISGGGGPGDTYNRVLEDFGTVGGGSGNEVWADHGTVGGGALNLADGAYSTVGGGSTNNPHGGASTVGGGIYNGASDNYATVGGGYSNVAGIGDLDSTNAEYATVGGGQDNEARAHYATIAGGGRSDPGNNATGNRVTDEHGTVGGGGNNQAGDDAGTTSDRIYATVAGGRSNTASASYATIGGGGESTPGTPATGNRATDNYCTVGGGGDNQAGDGGADPTTARYAAIGGGGSNLASGNRSTIAGGYNNEANAQDSTVGGGADNTSSASQATIGGGNGNDASGPYSTIGGGFDSIASSSGATVGGGDSNSASGYSATVPGGTLNSAAGDYSFAAGNRAKANNMGCFVWGDSYNGDVACSTDNRWVTRARGGYYLYTNSALTNYCRLDPGGGNWSCSSDRDLKENLTPVDGQAVLALLADMPITTWNMKDYDPSVRHVGPSAQDFYAAFGFGQDDLTIAAGDTSGVALAAIQGLYEIVQDLQAENADLKARVTALEGGTPLDHDSAGPLASIMPGGWLVLGMLLVLGGLVLAQRRLAGGRR